MDFDVFHVFSLIGIIAFAASGAVVAMEEGYDILGVFVLGLVTAFGGGVVRNLLIGIPVTTLWSQGVYLKTAFFAILIVFLMPSRLIWHWKRTEAFFDAIGLSAFAIQGSLFAVDAGLPLSAVMVAGMMTGIGGGMIRDIMVGRKPLVLRDEIYAVWAILAGCAVGLGPMKQPWQLVVLFSFVVLFRMLSVHYKWKLPRRTLSGARGHADDKAQLGGGL
ncbi:trimeric intracellular cation channel family protein [Cohnella pontilimi]|uniref:Trimeric intracellular cation channel family protein n=1 Tax=Cohnella pontilimi TaxID=2564100 RepID=A0A4U0FGT0_9BACL|nr:trimeric intracellular cation channel family protein [Cohnella pontilimi]TJY44213.1 trimeric intracellular cation channel family protein [Cohnella pontilimi]